MKKSKPSTKPKPMKEHFFTLGVRKTTDEVDYLSRFVLTVAKTGKGGLSMSFMQVPTKAIQFSTHEAAMVAYRALSMFTDGCDLWVNEHLL